MVSSSTAHIVCCHTLRTERCPCCEALLELLNTPPERPFRTPKSKSYGKYYQAHTVLVLMDHGRDTIPCNKITYHDTTMPCNKTYWNTPISTYHIILSYHIISYHIISYHITSISYHIISYHIISYHIMSSFNYARRPWRFTLPVPRIFYQSTWSWCIAWPNVENPTCHNHRIPNLTNF